MTILSITIYIRDYVTKCNFLTYHLTLYMCLFFMVLLSIEQPFFSIFVLHGYCHMFTFHVAVSKIKIGNKILLISHAHHVMSTNMWQTRDWEKMMKLRIFTLLVIFLSFHQSFTSRTTDFFASGVNGGTNCASKIW
jgi:hypothetical protein